MPDALGKLLSAAIAELMTDGPESLRTAALRTGGLPLFADWGGAIILLPSGELVGYNHESETVEVLASETWLRVGNTILLRKYPELARQLGTPVPTQVPCHVCAGNGLILSVRCGTCGGMGLQW